MGLESHLDQVVLLQRLCPGVHNKSLSLCNSFKQLGLKQVFNSEKCFLHTSLKETDMSSHLLRAPLFKKEV